MDSYRGWFDQRGGDLMKDASYMQTCTDDKPTSRTTLQRSTKLKAAHRLTGRCTPLGFHTGMTDCAEMKLMVTEVGAEPQTASAES